MDFADLNLIVYDFEVFAHDWLVVFKDGDDTECSYTSYWNDPVGLREFMEANEDAVFVGFNNKHYDQYIMKAIMAGCTPEEVKEVNDFIIEGGEQGWMHPYLSDLSREDRFWFNNADLMDDTQKGTSLKSIEGHLGMSVEESTVDFTYAEKLTEEQRREVEHYCRHDVDATERLMEIRRDYLETKLYLAAYANLNPYKALGMTDPKLAAALLQAEPIPNPEDDARDYEFPEQLDYSTIPGDVIGFFEQIGDRSIPDETLFGKESRHVHSFAGCEVTFAFGGLHGAVPKLRAEQRAGRLLLNYDVGSLYPSIMIEFGCISRAVPSVEVFKRVRDDRFAAKAAGDKRKANALKSPLNKTFGAMGNQYIDLYDPKNKLSVCVNGQLAVAELLARYERVKGLKVIQANTDGIAIDIPEDAYEEVLAINREWSERVKFTLDEDRIELIWQKDVNNYALRKTDGGEKVKGSYLVRGVSPIGAWSINNNARIVAEAVKRYLLDDIPVADTINACNDPFQFQIVAKAGSKYSRVYQEMFPEPVGQAGAETVSRQKCNRVFACKDERHGRLYKVKRSDGSVAKIESLPEHCLIWNDDIEENPPSMSLVDKSYYIRLAEKRARDFSNEEKEERKVATTKKGAAAAERKDMNIYAKLALARKMFQDKGVEKSGYNDHLGSEYFTLDDLTPPQTEIFEELGLFEHFTYIPPIFETVVAPDGVGTAVMTVPPYAHSVVYNTDKPEEFIQFSLPWVELKPQLSNQGKKVTHELMETGKAQTYFRRYLKQQILDVVEVDAAEEEKPEKQDKPSESTASEKPKTVSKPAKDTVKKAASKRPATSTERKKMAKSIANSDGEANDLMKKQLKNAVKRLKDDFGGVKEIAVWRANLAKETDRLENISQKRAEEALKEAGELRERHAGEEEGGER